MLDAVVNIEALRGIHGVDVDEVRALFLAAAPPDISIDEAFTLLCNLLGSKIVVHSGYDAAARTVLLTDLRRKTSGRFSEAMSLLRDNDVVSTSFYNDVVAVQETVDGAINEEADNHFSFFGLKTLLNGYLLSVRTKNGTRVVERPQYVFMRVAIAIHGRDTRAILETYNAMSNKLFIHATPTLFNSGAKHPQMSSCFLLNVPDGLSDIFDTVKNTAMISKFAGGIGLSMSGVRSKGSFISGTNGMSNGIVPLIKVFDSVGRYVDQAGKRLGSIAVYLEPHHADIEEFLELRKNNGNENARARDTFLGLWVSDLFMRRVKDDKTWSLFDPSTSPGLDAVWGRQYDELYELYEAKGQSVKQVSARALMTKIVESQLETGMPYMLYKDACNAKSNQQNLGTIKGSNLCAEVVEYASKSEVAVCNLASLGLHSYVRGGVFDFDALHHAAQIVTRNLNLVIDRNMYPVEEARTSNMRHRPIGIGIQGWADALVALGLPFDSPDAVTLAGDVSECIYHAAITQSMELSKLHGPYDSFVGSPASRGELQFDLWNVTPRKYDDWDAVKAAVVKHGLRNSLLVALMPTASSSQILGLNEAFEPFTSLIYKRKTLAGEYIIINKYLIAKLEELGLWNEEMRQRIIVASGSIASIDEIPEDVRALFRTAWDIKQRAIIDQAVARGPYVCQSASMNLWMVDPDFNKLTSAHIYTWQQGLKTGSYYIRTRQRANAQQFTIEPKARVAEATKIVVCADDVCTSCSA
jgi:ribonucleoside-diphosphate reductase alpha subunit